MAGSPMDDELGEALGLGSKKPKPGAAPMPGEEEEGGTDDADGEMAAQELLDAQAAGDAPGVWAAYKAMHAICSKSDY